MKFESEVARKYQKRLKKNEEKLFTFLKFDDVPWNNNCAEHAIKHFALYRNLSRGLFSAVGITQIMPEVEDRNREENTRCNWIRYPASSPWKGIAA